MEQYLNDLKENARRAFYNTSFDPEKRGERLINEFTILLNSDLEEIQTAATREGAEDIEEIKARYIEKFKTLFSSWLSSESNCASSFITGPSNFPAARMQKRRQWAENKYSALNTYRKRAKQAILKSFKKPVDPLEDAKKRLEKRERRHEKMKLINKAYFAYKKNPGSLETFEGLTEEEKRHVRTFQPQYSWESNPVSSWQLSNNSAEIRRLKDRIVMLSRKEEKRQLQKENESLELFSFPGGFLRNNYDIDRTQIMFEEIPDETMRAKLKKCAFRWSPTNKAWQRQLTPNAFNTAKSILADIKAG